MGPAFLLLKKEKTFEEDEATQERRHLTLAPPTLGDVTAKGKKWEARLPPAARAADMIISTFRAFRLVTAGNLCI